MSEKHADKSVFWRAHRESLQSYLFLVCGFGKLRPCARPHEAQLRTRQMPQGGKHHEKMCKIRSRPHVQRAEVQITDGGVASQTRKSRGWKSDAPGQVHEAKRCPVLDAPSVEVWHIPQQRCDCDVVDRGEGCRVCIDDMDGDRVNEFSDVGLLA